MICPSLNELPPAPAGKSGWPWTKESKPITAEMQKKGSLPRISIITPSFNQGEFIEETIRSVLLQGYPDLEYIIIDGGSTDITVEIIRKYEKWITFWVSEKDRGQSHAINKGFKKASGVIGNWINSDDLLTKNCLTSITEHLEEPLQKWVYSGIGIGADRDRLTERRGKSIKKCVESLENLVNIPAYWKNGDSISQQATFFPVELFSKVGGVSENNHFTMDYELWGKFLLEGATFKKLDIPLGIFRKYPGQKISNEYKTRMSLLKSAKELIDKESSWDKQKKAKLKKILSFYRIRYTYGHVRSIIGIKRRLNSLKSHFLKQ